jgi:hypothetical protein
MTVTEVKRGKDVFRNGNMMHGLKCRYALNAYFTSRNLYSFSRRICLCVYELKRIKKKIGANLYLTIYIWLHLTFALAVFSDFW